MSRIHILKGFSDVDSALWVLKYHPGTRSRADLVQIVRDNGYTVANKDYEIILLLTAWELVQRKPQGLTQKGMAFYHLWEVKRDVAIDVLHGLQYGLWTEHLRTQNTESWSYREVCNYLWDSDALPEKDDIISHIYSSLSDLEIDPEKAAFDGKSVNHAYDWLLPLSPPVLEGVRERANGRNFRNATFTRRSHCSTALFLMGLDWVARESGIIYGDLWMIGEEQRRQVCRFCLIDETRFDFMFNETLRRFSVYLSVRRSGGLYIVINNEPQISDF
ncbi:hypothetical protein F4054_17555 [Candidatus Poribacteria bacterium]|nr:hypothetical protein [Candidatus Poribacteria bacterium]MYK24051.1 hypothetical protein [Candidatus Poribacteria bacterium]